jgi:hypothetical protein
MGIPVVGRSLLHTAVEHGLVDENAVDALNSSCQINKADLGIDPDQITTDQVNIATVLLDNSGSMESWESRVLSSYASALNTMKEAESRHNILVGALGLCGNILYRYKLVKDAQPLTKRSYWGPDGPLDHTPLHRQIVKLCRLVKEKQGQLLEAGIPARTITLLMTDAGDSDKSHELKAAAQKAIGQLLNGSKKNRVYGIAFGSEAKGALYELGIPRETLFEAGNEKDLLDAFIQFSQATSAVM